MPVSDVLALAFFSAAIESASFKSSGDAITAELTSMNFLLVRFGLDSLIILLPPFDFIPFNMKISEYFIYPFTPCLLHEHDFSEFDDIKAVKDIKSDPPILF